MELTILGVTFLPDMGPDQLCLRDMSGAQMLQGEPLNPFPEASSI